MKRRLVRQGSSTLTVSLPASWIQKNKLTNGDDVSIEVEENIVRVSASPVLRGTRSIELNVRKYSEALLSDIIQCLYKKGYDELRLVCEQQQVTKIQQILKHSLLGFEIVEQSPKAVTIRFVTRVDESELDALVRRLFLVTLSLGEALTVERDDIDDLYILEETSDRLANYCENILTKHIASRKNAVFLYQFVSTLERIADEYRRVVELEDIDTADAAVCHDVLRKIYDLYYSYDAEKHDAILAEITSARRLLVKKKSSMAPVLYVAWQLMEPITAMHL